MLNRAALNSSHSRYIPGDGMASMPPMAMGAISRNAGALVVAREYGPDFAVQAENMRRFKLGPNVASLAVN